MSPYDRSNPYQSHLVARSLLTKNGSTRQTFHLSLDLRDSQISYKPGDSLAILPSNDPAAVDCFLEQASAVGNESIHDPRTQEPLFFRDYLTHKANLLKTTPSFLKALFERDSSSYSDLLLAENKTKMITFLAEHTPAELLQLHPKAALSPTELAKLLLPMLPRFYSIASSQLLFPEEVHLTVASLSYHVRGIERFGVGSHFLCKRALLRETPIPFYVQTSHNFTLPEDPLASIILIGPGTGIAPFRAFLQERLAKQAKGKNWLFFGERNRATDFYYEDFWLSLEHQGRLRLDCAFSRDGSEKIYVQHKLWEQKKDLWCWIEEGAYLYICGNAEKMAKDVELTLQKIAISEGALTEELARAKIKTLKTEKRLLMDVY